MSFWRARTTGLEQGNNLAVLSDSVEEYFLDLTPYGARSEIDNALIKPHQNGSPGGSFKLGVAHPLSISTQERSRAQQPLHCTIPPLVAMAEGGSRDDAACLPSFLDPVTYEIMRDPVFTADGQTFERQTIEQWLRDHDTSPLHGGRLEHTRLVPNIALRQSIDEWRAKYHRIIPMSAIVIGAQIGRGGFKVVHRGTLSLPGARAPTEVAVLRVRTADVAAEVATLLQLGKHPRLIRFFGQCEGELDTLLITEYVALPMPAMYELVP
jgi:hypothetical protein